MSDKEIPIQAKPVGTVEPLQIPVKEEQVVADESSDGTTDYPKGWLLSIMTTALSLAVFLVSLEVSIVATSLVAITDELQGFNRSSWLVTAYMLTYTGFLIISAKFSDIFGRKLLIVTSLCIFVIFSSACGAAQTIDQLIIFRALQGIGGAGTYSLCFVIFFEMVPPEKFGPYSSMLSAVFAIALLLGPLLGGVINKYTTWRWVFLINAPAGVVSIILVIITIPRNFPYHGLSSLHGNPTLRQKFSRAQLGRVDFLGTVLLLSAAVLLVTAFEEAGVQYPWNSSFVISILAVSALCWIAFFTWSRKVTRMEGAREPIFPWRFVESRICIGLLVDMFLTGAPFTVAVIQIPLKFQAVYGLSSLGAGIRLLPFAIASPIGSGVAAGLASRAKLPPVYIMLGGSAIQIVGFTLLSVSPTTGGVNRAEYAYEAIAGFSVGVNLACLILMTPFSVEKRDKSVAMSATIQFRTMGGAIGLAVVTAATNTYVKKHLAESFSSTQIEALLQTTEAFAKLSPAMLDTARTTFAQGYNLQMRIMIGFSAAQIPATFLMWQKEQIVI